MLRPGDAEVTVLAGPTSDPVATLEALAEEVGAGDTYDKPPTGRPDRPTGAIDLSTLAAAVGATLPDGAIVADEANSSGLAIPGATAGGPAHDWLCLTGGSIGIGLPLALGASIACPDRRVVSIEADGSAMYTLQALWTMARENADVTVVIADNRSYAVLNMELDRVGADAAGPKAREMFDLHGPRPRLRGPGRGHGCRCRAGRLRGGSDHPPGSSQRRAGSPSDRRNDGPQRTLRHRSATSTGTRSLEP